MLKGLYSGKELIKGTLVPECQRHLLVPFMVQDQNKRPLCFRFAVSNCGAGFSCRIGEKILAEKNVA